MPHLALQIFCSRLALTGWLQNHLLPCPFKYLTGYDCPGCGFQRSLIALFEGDFFKSFSLYPPTLAILIFFIYRIAERFLQLEHRKPLLRKFSMITLSVIIMGSYGFKLANLYLLK